MDEGMLLSDGQIAIRPVTSQDAEPFFAAIQESKDEVGVWLPDLAAARSVADVARWAASQPAAWAAGTVYSLVIVDANTGSCLGGAGLSHVNLTHRFANLFYWVRTSRTGQGIASAATRLMARFAFDTLGLKRMEIVVATDNRPSLRAAEKAGAVREGLLRNRILLHGTCHDAVVFSLIPQDIAATARA